MANDINNAKSGATDNTGSIKLGTVVVQAPIKTFTANNFIDESEYTSYTRPSGTHIYGIDKIQDKYDARFDDPTYYSA
jgi:hypothetical protein